MKDIASLLEVCKRKCYDYHGVDNEDESISVPNRCVDCPITEFISLILLNRAKSKYAESELDKAKKN